MQYRTRRQTVKYTLLRPKISERRSLTRDVWTNTPAGVYLLATFFAVIPTLLESFSIPIYDAHPLSVVVC